MPLQLNTIEEYNFVHGLHRNYVNGKYIAIQPHDLGRPLTHAEMDYNLILNEQTQAGFRIFGSNADLTLSDDDIGKSLVFHKITADDDDFTKYQSKGYSVNQYIWILSCCDHFHCEFFVTDHHDGITSTDSEWCQFVVDTISSEDSGVCAFIVDSITSTPEDPCVTFVVDTIVAQDSLIHAGTPTPTPSSSEAAPTPTPSSSEVTPTPTPSSSEAAPTPTPTPTTSAVYPMLGYDDDQAWLQVLADWEANNPDCQTPQYSTGSFFQEKASISNSFTSDPLLSSTHRRRHVLKLVSEIQPLDAALLEEYRIWKGCQMSGPNTNTPSNNDRYSMSVIPAAVEESEAGNPPQYMQFAIQAINGYDPAPGTTVGYTITGDWSQGDIQVLGIELSDPNNISSPVPSAQPNTVLNPYTNIFKIGTEQGTGYKTAAIRVYAAADVIIENVEAVRVTLDEYDSTGNMTSGVGVWNTGHISDEL